MILIIQTREKNSNYINDFDVKNHWKHDYYAKYQHYSEFTSGTCKFLIAAIIS